MRVSRHFSALLVRHDAGHRNALRPCVTPAVLLALTGVAVVAVASRGSAVEPIVLGAVFLASAVSSIAGFAFSAICGSMLFHLPMDPVRIVQVMITCSIANQAAMTWAMAGTIEWAGLAAFLCGGVLGVPVGVWVLLHADRATYTFCLGCFLVAYGFYMLTRPPLTLRQSPAFDVVAGVLGGITGGALGFPGAPVTIWCATKGWTKERQRALFQPFIFVLQILGLIAISVSSDRTTASTQLFGNLVYVPGALLGTWIGLSGFRRLSDKRFGQVVNGMLIVSGVLLMT